MDYRAKGLGILGLGL